MLAKSLSGEEIACEVINSLSIEYGVISQQEFAAIVDAGKQFVQATYKLEGDGPLRFSAMK